MLAIEVILLFRAAGPSPASHLIWRCRRWRR